MPLIAEASQSVGVAERAGIGAQRLVFRSVAEDRYSAFGGIVGIGDGDRNLLVKNQQAVRCRDRQVDRGFGFEIEGNSGLSVERAVDRIYLEPVIGNRQDVLALVGVKIGIDDEQVGHLDAVEHDFGDRSEIGKFNVGGRQIFRVDPHQAYEVIAQTNEPEGHNAVNNTDDFSS